jgi:hypothetical protein
MNVLQKCAACGAVWSGEKTCQDDFYQMLAWEAEYPAFLEVHHLMVLCFHLQHPNLYSQEGLTYARQLLVEFVERGVSPREIRQRNHAQVNSRNRHWKIKGTPTSHGVYDRPILWTTTAADIVAGGTDGYCDRVRAWAQSIYETLKMS